MSVDGQDSRHCRLAQIAEAEAQLHATAMRWLDPLPVPADLTLRQVQVLALLRANADLTGQELAALLRVSTPTTSGIIDRIAAKGWLDRQPDPADRRRVLMRITAAGEEVLMGLEGPTMRARAMVLDRLGDDELADLARLMERMRDVAVEVDAERSPSS